VWIAVGARVERADLDRRKDIAVPRIAKNSASSPMSDKRRKPVRVRNPQESRRALIDAAAQIFNTVGYHGTDTNRIAIAAGYTPGTFYTHFQDKRSIFLEVYRRWVDEEFAAITAALNSVDKGSRREKLARSILDHHRKWRVFRASLCALYAIDEEVRKARLIERERQIEMLIKHAKESGHVPPTRAAALASLLSAEGICDAIATGDAKALGVKESDLFGIFEQGLRIARRDQR
jgi:AcrR family transcriptional regulator